MPLLRAWRKPVFLALTGLLALPLWAQHGHTGHDHDTRVVFNNDAEGEKAECLTVLEEIQAHLLENPWDKHRPARLQKAVACAETEEEFTLALGLSESLLEQARSQAERADILDTKASLLARRNGPEDGMALRTTLQLLRHALKDDQSPEGRHRSFLAAFDLAVWETDSLHPRIGKDEAVDALFETLLGEATNDRQQAQVFRLWAEVYARSRFLPDPANRALELIGEAIPLLTYDLKPPLLYQRALWRYGQDQFDGALSDVSLALLHERPGTPLREGLEDLHERLTVPVLEVEAQRSKGHVVVQVKYRNQPDLLLTLTDRRNRVVGESRLPAAGPRFVEQRLLWVLTPVQDKRTLTGHIDAPAEEGVPTPEETAAPLWQTELPIPN